MTVRRTLAARSLAAVLLTLPLAAQASHDPLAMGKMWTFENPPLAYLEQEYGFKPDQRWLDSLRLGALRLGERENPWCSASFVSPRGLIMTNHHCVRDEVAKIQGQNDWVEDGYAATALADEVPIPGLTVQQLVAQEDVTDRVDADLPADGDDVAIEKKRAANIEAIEAAADAQHPGFMHQVVALYQGAVYELYRYRVFDDLRLVLAVNLQCAHFGGDPDNFTYPRWSIDFSFVRAYENGEPADTSANYFRWRAEGAQDGELVFVPGNPGQTNRLLTRAQLEVQRDIEYPIILGQLHNGMAILRPYADRAAGLLTTLLSWENSHKAIQGMLDGLQDERLMAKKRAHEEHFRAAVAGNPDWQAKYGEAWTKLAELSDRRRAVYPKVHFYSPSYSTVIERAVAIAKALDESLPPAERDRARTDALGMAIGGNVLTRAMLIDHFERAERWLGRRDPFVDVVASAPMTDGPLSWPDSIDFVERSELRSDRFVQRLLDAEDAAAQFAASEDAGIRAGRVLWPLMRDADREQEAVESAIAVQGTLLGQALHAVYGAGTSPDATMTLRFSDGRVQGYDYNGTKAPWSTTLYGLYGRSEAFGHVHPFDLAEPWVAAEPRLDLSKRVCFASTNDIVGGNSGSCVVDRDLQVVGLIFDGNIESLANDFYYTQEVARAVSVHTDAIVTALERVYGMQRIADELRAGSR
ncbi:MAG: S46 family peptidase [Planctomycetes bacterium]|nr:S46 family peptidase [Planctomycetota bacterium]